MAITSGDIMFSPTPCDASRSTLLLIDLQQRLMPAIHEHAAVLRQAHILAQAAKLLQVPAVATAQNPERLGANDARIAALCTRVIDKMAFDASAEAALIDALDPSHDIIVAGCEAHVCVLQTVLGLRARGWKVKVAADAIGSRAASSKDAAIMRMRAAGADVVTAEMVVFEWLRDCKHPHFRECLALVK
jgi:nicotinamidase-related amidase